MFAFLNSPMGGAVVALVLSGVLRGMPEPPAGSFWLRWLYNSCQLVGANFDKFKGAA